jgi:hypothetical protein
MERGTLIQHLEGIIICEESSIDVDGNRVILNVYPMMTGEKKKVEKFPTNASKLGEKECRYSKKFNHQGKKCFWNPNNPKKKLKKKHEVVVTEVAT